MKFSKRLVAAAMVTLMALTSTQVLAAGLPPEGLEDAVAVEDIVAAEEEAVEAVDEEALLDESELPAELIESEEEEQTSEEEIVDDESMNGMDVDDEILAEDVVDDDALEVERWGEWFLSKPSAWAKKEVFMAEMYGVAVNAWFVDYQGNLTFSDFLQMHKQFCARLGVTDTVMLPADGVISRGYVLRELYDVVCVATKTPAPNTNAALAFFVEQGLISGRVDGDYGLTEVCTVQEALIFTKRVVEHVLQDSGDASTGFLWRISDEDNVVYLLGSIHVGTQDLFPMSKSIMDAYEATAHLAVEIDILDEEIIEWTDELLESIAEYEVFMDGTVLKDVLDEETYAVICEIMAWLEVPEEEFEQFKPWVFVELLTAIYEMEMAYEGYEAYAEYIIGIDEFFLLLAKMEEKQIHSLETMDLQVELMCNMPMPVQVEMLKYMLGFPSAMEEDGDISIEDMIRVWCDGDAEKLAKIAGHLPEDENEIQAMYNKKMLTDRNEGMIVKVQIMLEGTGETGNDDVLVVVGAAHVIYEDGIVAAFEAMGYTVERLR